MWCLDWCLDSADTYGKHRPHVVWDFDLWFSSLNDLRLIETRHIMTYKCQWPFMFFGAKLEDLELYTVYFPRFYKCHAESTVCFLICLKAVILRVKQLNCGNTSEVDVSLMLDNQAAYKVCENKLHLAGKTGSFKQWFSWTWRSKSP